MSGEDRDRRDPARVPVASKRITLRLPAAGLPESDERVRTVPARLLELSRGGMSGSGGLEGIEPGTRVEVEIDVPWWLFARRLTVPGVVQRVAEGGSRWDIQFSVEDDATGKRLERFVDRVHDAYRGLVKDGAGARLREALRRIELGFGDSTTDGTRVVLIGSAAAGEGKGPVAAGLSIVLAREGKRVLLVDADPESAAIPGALEPSRGLYDLLAFEERKVDIESLSFPVWPNVRVLPVGRPPDSSSSRLAEAIGPVVARLRHEGYRYIIVNAPPLLHSVNGSLLAAAADDVFVVVRTGVSKERDLVEVRDLLSRAKASFRGIILTDEAEEVPPPARRSFWSVIFRHRPRNAAPPSPARAGHHEEERWSASEVGR